MMLTILRIQYLRLRNNPLELLLVFVMPVLFFSIFAMIFSRGIASGTEQPVRLGLAVPERTEAAEALMLALAAAETVQCLDLGVSGSDEAGVDAAIENAQNSGRYDLILKLPPQFSEHPAIQLITDGQNAMATAIVTAHLKEYYAKRQMDEAAAVVEKLIPQTVSGSESPTPTDRGSPSPVSVDESLVFSRPAGADEVFRTPAEEAFLDEQSGGLITVWDPPALELQLRPNASLVDPEMMDSESAAKEALDAAAASGTADNLQSPVAAFPVRKEVPIEVVNPQAGGRTNPRIAMYAAGVAVLFLLFACTGHAGTMLEEAESGTLDRILASHAGLLQILAGKWLGIFLMGCLQLTVMFVFAELVFGIELAEHWQGFVVMAACTSAATSGFALFLATMCRSRAQLNALATVIILSMSAIGGSMIPRFVMSEQMKELGRFSFNAWALDGFQKVFWFRVPVSELKAETAVLLGSALVMGLLTVVFSGRWKRGI
jgi:ABC-2 type transport system permease protein